ncbi:hypothetical protein HOD08_02120, partial [bacterium]|nr:hypothetical protein [bacterium]
MKNMKYSVTKKISFAAFVFALACSGTQLFADGDDNQEISIEVVVQELRNFLYNPSNLVGIQCQTLRPLLDKINLQVGCYNHPGSLQSALDKHGIELEPEETKKRVVAKLFDLHKQIQIEIVVQELRDFMCNPSHQVGIPCRTLWPLLDKINLEIGCYRYPSSLQSALDKHGIELEPEETK